MPISMEERRFLVDEIKLGDWLPQEPWQGPPLPEFLNIYWPWYKPPTDEFPVSDIRAENLIITPSEVYVGEKVSISVTAKNYGTAAGKKTIICTVSPGDFTAEQTVELAPGESQQVSFEAVPHADKVYQVSVDGLSGSFKAEPSQPDFFMPPDVTAEMEYTWGEFPYYHYRFEVTIENRGNAAGTYSYTYEVLYNSSVIFERATKSITLGPGQSFTFLKYYDIRWDVVANFKVSLSGSWPENNYATTGWLTR